MMYSSILILITLKIVLGQDQVPDNEVSQHGTGQAMADEQFEMPVKASVPPPPQSQLPPQSPQSPSSQSNPQSPSSQFSSSSFQNSHSTANDVTPGGGKGRPLTVKVVLFNGQLINLSFGIGSVFTRLDNSGVHVQAGGKKFFDQDIKSDYVITNEDKNGELSKRPLTQDDVREVEEKQRAMMIHQQEMAYQMAANWNRMRNSFKSNWLNNQAMQRNQMRQMNGLPQMHWGRL